MCLDLHFKPGSSNSKLEKIRVPDFSEDFNLNERELENPSRFPAHTLIPNSPTPASLETSPSQPDHQGG